MYFVTCDDDKNRKRKLNSLVCTLNDTCVKTMHSTESTLAARKSFETIFRRPSLFSILRCIPMPRTLSVFPCFTIWRKQKSYPQINLETSNDTSARQSFDRMDTFRIYPSSPGFHCLSVVAVGRKVFSPVLRLGRFLSRCPPVKRLFGVQASRRTTLHSALTSYRCGSL